MISRSERTPKGVERMVFFTPKPASTTLSQELRDLINNRNVLTARSKSKVLDALDAQIEESKKTVQTTVRDKAIEEIFTSEVSYLHQVELIIKYFKEPLSKLNLMPDHTLSSLFGDIESIYRVNGEFVHQLRIQGNNVGAAFLCMAPYFKSYATYAFNYRSSLTLLQSMTRHNKAMRQFVKSQESRPEVGTTLSALLIAPIQRLPRYRLLLKQLVSLTSHTHPHYQVLTEAVKQIEVTNEHIDSLVDGHERQARLVTLHHCIVGSSGPSIVAANRKLLKEGILMKMSSDGLKAQKRYFILLNDTIVCCKLKGNLKEDQLPDEPKSLQQSAWLPLNKCVVQNVLGEGVFNLSCSMSNYILFSDHKENVLSWVEAIQKAKAQLEENLKTLKKRSSSRYQLQLNKNKKRTFSMGCNETSEEKEEIPTKKAKVEENIQEEEVTKSYFQSIKSIFRTFGQSVIQFLPTVRLNPPQ